MDPQSLSQIALWSGAEFFSGDPLQLVTGISHDTRDLKPGDLYIALQGENFDGNNFILEASQKGAVGAICSRKLSEVLPDSFGILRVSHSLEALTSLAYAWRQQLSLRSIVLTGSSGKTTTKDFTTAVLRSSFQTTSTQGNLNNHIGVPLSILKASSLDQIAVWEIGMNHRGEIAPLASLTQPDIAIITNIGTAHIGFLGSREAIAEEKGDLLAALSQKGVAILPAADPFCETLAQRTEARIVRVGIDVGELRATDLVASSIGTHFQVCYHGELYPAFLPVVGRHMVSNALLGLAAALECGMPLEQAIEALKKIQPSKSRLFVQECHGMTLVDDSYNANPDSMEAALKTISGMACTGRRIAVLGRMGELGNYEKKGYKRVGKVVAATVDILITVGSQTAPLFEAAGQAGLKEAYIVSSNEMAVNLLLSLAHKDDLILVKGSASANLKSIVDKITNENN